jgi:hypothetical protein
MRIEHMIIKRGTRGKQTDENKQDLILLNKIKDWCANARSCQHNILAVIQKKKICFYFT